MRADRLLRLILVMSDGRARPARVLADEVEVSLRTLFRDLEALAEAGIPVIRARGRRGGIALPREWTRYASGLGPDEVVPLAALAPPGDARIGGALEAALAKIVAALPSVLRARAEEARQRLLIDPTPWWSSADPPELLDDLRQAVWADREVDLRYRDGEGRETERRVRPLALALKADRWHLVADTDRGPRVFRGDRILAATVRAERFRRPADFDLPTFWREWCARFERTRPAYRVRLALTDRGRELLAAARPARERAHIREAPEPEVDFQRADIAIAQLAPLGGEARVLAPDELAERLRALGRAWAG